MHIDEKLKKWSIAELPNFLEMVIDVRNYFQKDQYKPLNKAEKGKYTKGAAIIHSKL
jgi:hypothetical protein